jgi:hypothetical protein
VGPSLGGIRPVPVGGASGRLPGPPPRPGIQYQPVNTLPAPPPMMMRPPQQQPPSSTSQTPASSGAALLHPPGQCSVGMEMHLLSSSSEANAVQYKIAYYESPNFNTV